MLVLYHSPRVEINYSPHKFGESAIQSPIKLRHSSSSVSDSYRPFAIRRTFSSQEPLPHRHDTELSQNLPEIEGSTHPHDAEAPLSPVALRSLRRRWAKFFRNSVGGVIIIPFCIGDRTSCPQKQCPAKSGNSEIRSKYFRPMLLIVC